MVCRNKGSLTVPADRGEADERRTQLIEAAYRDHVSYSVCDSLILFRTCWPLLTFPYENFEKTTYNAWTNPQAQFYSTTSKVLAFGTGFAHADTLDATPDSACVIRSSGETQCRRFVFSCRRNSDLTL